jgi:hypothetical protein
MDLKFIAFTASHNDPEEPKSYYSESSDEEELKEANKTLFILYLTKRDKPKKCARAEHVEDKEKHITIKDKG